MISIKNKEYTAFEQDIRELLQAFFPGEEITGEEAGEAFFGSEGGENTAEGSGIRTSITVDADSLMKDTALTGNRFEDKTLIKGALYRYLAGKTGRELPWGTLTGIKPVKLADKLFAEGLNEPETDRKLAETYRISDRKRKLMLSIALRERRLLEQLHGHGTYSVYMGIPFCPTRCLYCSFTSNPIALFRDRVGEYLDCMERELAEFREFTGETVLTPSTLYIGGGTPTALSAPQLEKLLCGIERHVDTKALLEFTVEAGRPDSITKEKLEVLRDHGISRISVNPQTMNQKTLDLIGRRHTVQQTLDAFRLARSLGFDNINMDVIMGLPGETEEDVKHTLAVIEDLKPESLTVHSLAVKRAARLSTEHDPWKDYERAEGEAVSRMTGLGAETAERLGMKPYYLYRQKNIAGNQENVGYAVPGTESLYNIIMMEEKQPVIGFGAGSTTKLGTQSAERMENIKDLKLYLDRSVELLEKRRKFFEEYRDLLKHREYRLK